MPGVAREKVQRSWSHCWEAWPIILEGTIRSVRGSRKVRSKRAVSQELDPSGPSVTERGFWHEASAEVEKSGPLLEPRSNVEGTTCFSRSVSDRGVGWLSRY